MTNHSALRGPYCDRIYAATAFRSRLCRIFSARSAATVACEQLRQLGAVRRLDEVCIEACAMGGVPVFRASEARHRHEQRVPIARPGRP